MRLRNKKTGGIIEIYLVGDTLRFKRLDKKTESFDFNSLKDLTEEWEDYEEPYEPYRLTTFGEVVEFSEGSLSNKYKRMCVDIGNYFSTKEEAEKAVEKLKAWKRLKDKGTIFKDWFWDKHYGTCIILGTKEKDCVEDENEEVRKDLDLLFGGEK